jgi:futalosine hydrolase
MSKRILLVSATQAELPRLHHEAVESLVTGVGMVTTAYSLTRKLSELKYDLVIDIGIAGSFNPSFGIGSVVQVVSDRIVELGVEDNGRFIPADEMNLVTTDDVLFHTKLRVCSLPEAHGITVNRVHGSSDSIENIVGQFNPDVESMEGAAVAYVCKQFGVPWVQIRTISNLVEPRNRDAWDIPMAIQNLHSEVLKYIDSLRDEA